MLWKNPASVVLIFEGQKGKPELLGVPEGLQPKKVLFENPDESLGTTVTPRLVDKSRSRFNTKEGDLLLEQIRYRPGAVIVAKGQTLGDTLSKSSEVVPDSLPDREKIGDAVRLLSY